MSVDNKMWKIKAKIGISKCSRKHEYCNKYKNLTKKLFGHYKYFLASTLVLVCSRKWQCSYRGNVMDDATFSADSVTIGGGGAGGDQKSMLAFRAGATFHL